MEVINEMYSPSKSRIRDGFRRVTRQKAKGYLRLPRFEIETVEDMYVYYVIMNGISEDLFWYSEYNSCLRSWKINMHMKRGRHMQKNRCWRG